MLRTISLVIIILSLHVCKRASFLCAKPKDFWVHNQKISVNEKRREVFFDTLMLLNFIYRRYIDNKMIECLSYIIDFGDDWFILMTGDRFLYGADAGMMC